MDNSTRHHATGDWMVDVAGYDARDRPTGRTWTVPAGVTGLAGVYSVSYGYDAADHQTTMGYPAVGGLAAETTTTTFNSIGLPETMTSGADEYVPVAAYDDRARPFLFGFGQTPAGLSMGKGWTYDNNQRLSGMQASASGGVQVQDRTIGYDRIGNVTERNTTLDGASWRECYGYDQRQRLDEAWTTSANCTSGTRGTGANPYNHTYAYTHDGNIDARTEGPTTIDYTYPAGGPSSTRPHAPTEVGSDDYTWDANGNPDTRTIAGQTEDLTWDPEHRLVAVDDPDGDSNFVYDADGTRLLRQGPDGATLYIEGHEITAPTAGTTTAVRSYNFEGNLIATRDTDGVDYLATDNQGSVELSVPAGATTPDIIRTYYPYGQRRTGTQLASDRAWIGQIEDDTTGLQYLNARYYDPTIGVFTAPDPLGDVGRPKTLNPYAYAITNPSTFSDPSGMWVPVGAQNPTEGAYDARWSATARANGIVSALIAQAPRDAAVTEAVMSVGTNGCFAETSTVGAVTCNLGGYSSGLDVLAQIDQRVDLVETLVWELTIADYERCLTEGDTESCLWTLVDLIPGVGGVDAVNDARRVAEGIDDGRRAGDTMEDVVDAARSVTNAPLGRGSTGRTAPTSLREQLALEEAMSNPAGIQVPIRMTDSRWPANEGWIKMAQNVNSVEIHYVYNVRTGEVDDFKFAEKVVH